MTKFFKIIPLFLIVGVFSSCSQVLQTVDLKVNTKDNSFQEEFNVIEKTLTLKTIKQNRAPYNRTVLQNVGENARPIPEKLALKSNFK